MDFSLAYRREELFHSTSASIYWMIILDYFKIRNFWFILFGSSFIHYFITASSSVDFGRSLFFLALSLFLEKASRCKLSYKRKESGEAKLIVDTLRYIVASLVCISIFMCDFSFYPEHKLKSKYFGISLMDFGVVCFMLNAGLISSISHRFRMRKSIYMAVMGLIRLFVIMMGYHSDESEYGIYFNFYFIYLLSENLSVLFRNMDPFYSSLLLLLGHELMISVPSVPEYVFFAKRDGFISSNREGLISIVPYAAVLLFGKGIGREIFKKEKTGRTLFKMFFIWGTVTALHFLFMLNVLPSRRLCSLSFISFCCSAVLFPICIIYGVSCFYTMEKIELVAFFSPLMNSLFLLGNLYVLIGNLLLKLGKLSAFYSHLLNVLYLFMLFVVPAYLQRTYRSKKVSDKIRV